MALIPQFTADQSSDCTSFDYVISTGMYDDPDNLGGYGAPNPASSATTLYILNILLPEATVPYIYTFTIASNVITAATQTDPLGVVTNIYADLASTVFPFTAADPFTITGEMLGGAEDSTLSDGVYNGAITESGTGPFEVENDTDFLLQCLVCKCKDQKFAALSPADCNCDCGKIEKLMDIDAFIQAANSAMDVGYSEQAQIAIDKATDLCNGDCGCGD